jgi:hypothetical protein
MARGGRTTCARAPCHGTCSSMERPATSMLLPHSPLRTLQAQRDQALAHCEALAAEAKQRAVAAPAVASREPQGCELRHSGELRGRPSEAAGGEDEVGALR